MMVSGEFLLNHNKYTIAQRWVETITKSPDPMSYRILDIQIFFI